jgi:hypothetical protein
MKRIAGGFVELSAAAILGCAIPLAPGADQVRITRNAADVEGCTPVGNIDRTDPNSDVHGQMQNQAVGLGGNVVFETSPILAHGGTGVVYRCGGR